MNQEDAKSEIIKLWNKREIEFRTHMDILGFYLKTEREQPEILDFNCSGDKYQTIKLWLIPHTAE